MSISDRKVKTSHAEIALSETSGDGLPIIFLHGNSSCKEVFRRQLESPLGDTNRLIAMDLPGHGASGDAFNPEMTYTMPGYAEAAIEALGVLGVQRAAVVGWSLGGHVALEMIPRFDGIVGAMIMATPPVGQGAEKVMAGFRPIPNAEMVGKLELSPEEAEIFLYANYGPSFDPALRDALVRTDGRARAVMFQSLLTGTISDQKAIVETSDVPVAVVNGADDPLVNVEYVGGLAYRNLWDNHCYVLRGAGHASFLHAPEAFSAILDRFVNDMAKRKSEPRRKTRTAAA
jgi:pimeloyl-ACP methyl ester carboxylesterase